jgi:hypothetical protein
MQREFLRKYVNALPGGVNHDLPILEGLMPGVFCVDDNQKTDRSSLPILHKTVLAYNNIEGTRELWHSSATIPGILSELLMTRTNSRSFPSNISTKRKSLRRQKFVLFSTTIPAIWIQKGSRLPSFIYALFR